VAAACMMGGACAGSNLRALFRMAELRPRFQFLVGRTDGYELRKRDEGNPAGSRGFGVASQTGYMVSVVARQLHALLQLVVDVLLQFHFHGGVLELLISDQTAGACIIIILTKNCKCLFISPLIYVN
jgi:hypothetical protein